MRRQAARNDGGIMEGGRELEASVQEMTLSKRTQEAMKAKII